MNAGLLFNRWFQSTKVGLGQHCATSVCRVRQGDKSDRTNFVGAAIILSRYNMWLRDCFVLFMKLAVVRSGLTSIFDAILGFLSLGLAVKRCLDILVAAVALFVFAGPLLFLMALVKLTSKGQLSIGLSASVAMATYSACKTAHDGNSYSILPTHEIQNAEAYITKLGKVCGEVVLMSCRNYIQF